MQINEPNAGSYHLQRTVSQGLLNTSSRLDAILQRQIKLEALLETELRVMRIQLHNLTCHSLNQGIGRDGILAWPKNRHGNEPDGRLRLKDDSAVTCRWLTKCQLENLSTTSMRELVDFYGLETIEDVTDDGLRCALQRFLHLPHTGA